MKRQPSAAEGNVDNAAYSTPTQSTKELSPKVASTGPLRSSRARVYSPQKQLATLLNILVNETNDSITKEVGADTQILSVESTLNVFLAEGYASEKNAKDIELLTVKVIPHLCDSSDPPGTIQRAMILYYVAALFMVTRYSSIEAIPSDIQPIVERYTYPHLLTFAYKTVQLRYNHVANVLNRTHPQEQEGPSFKPEINNNAESLSTTYWGKLSTQSDDFCKRIEAWAKHREKARQDAIHRVQQEEEANLTFVPAINKRRLRTTDKKRVDAATTMKSSPLTKRQLEDAATARLYEQGIERHMKIQRLYTDNLDKTRREEMAKCTFTPHIIELKKSIISGASMVSATDTQRRSIVSAIARMRQSHGQMPVTNQNRYSRSSSRHFSIVDNSSKKLSRTLMKTLDLVVSPSPPASSSRSMRSTTPLGPSFLSSQNVCVGSATRKQGRQQQSQHEKCDFEQIEQILSAAAVFSEEIYTHKSPHDVNLSYAAKSGASVVSSEFSLSRPHSPSRLNDSFRDTPTSTRKLRSPTRTRSPKSASRQRSSPNRIESFKSYPVGSAAAAEVRESPTYRQKKSLFLQQAFPGQQTP